jgi:hypothetical protein
MSTSKGAIAAIVVGIVLAVIALILAGMSLGQGLVQDGAIDTLDQRLLAVESARTSDALRLDSVESARTSDALRLDSVEDSVQTVREYTETNLLLGGILYQDLGSAVNDPTFTTIGDAIQAAATTTQLHGKTPFTALDFLNLPR